MNERELIKKWMEGSHFKDESDKKSIFAEDGLIYSRFCLHYIAFIPKKELHKRIVFVKHDIQSHDPVYLEHRELILDELRLDESIKIIYVKDIPPIKHSYEALKFWLEDEFLHINEEYNRLNKILEELYDIKEHRTIMDHHQINRYANKILNLKNQFEEIFSYYGYEELYDFLERTNNSDCNFAKYLKQL